MKSKSIGATLLSVLCLVAAPAARAAPAPTGQERAEAAGKGLIGAPAPRLVLRTIDGQRIDLGSVYGKQAVYLKFWATWCVPCREQMPHFEHAFESAPPSLAVIAVNVGFNDTLGDVQEYRKRLGLRMPIVIDDGRLAEALHLRVTPQHVLIGRDGRILYVGHLANDRLDAAILAAGNGAAADNGAPAGNAALADNAAAANNAAAAASTAAVAPGYGIGDRLPSVSVTTLEGTSFAFRPRSPQQRTVLVFLSPWCESYLAASRPALASDCRDVRTRVESLAGRSNIRWLGIASGLWATRGELASYRDEHKVSIALTLDESGELFRKFRVMTVPTVLIADENGRIVRRLEGHSALGLGEHMESKRM